MWASVLFLLPNLDVDLSSKWRNLIFVRGHYRKSLLSSRKVWSMLVRYEADGVLAGRNVSAQVVIRPCGHLLSYLHAHDNLGLTTCRSCHMILCSLPKVLFRSTCLPVTHWTLWVHSSDCCSVANMELMDSELGFHGISICLDTTGRARATLLTSALPRRGPTVPHCHIPLHSPWWGLNSGPRHHLWKS